MNSTNHTREAISKLRAEIDAIDTNWVQLLAKRFKLVQQIGEIKKTANISVQDPSRKLQIEQRLKELCENEKLSNDVVYQIYQIIHDEAARLQNETRQN